MGLRTFEIPLELPAISLSMAWHPHFEADGAHAWLRQQVRSVVHETTVQNQVLHHGATGERNIVSALATAPPDCSSIKPAAASCRTR